MALLTMLEGGVVESLVAIAASFVFLCIGLCFLGLAVMFAQDIWGKR